MHPSTLAVPPCKIHADTFPLEFYSGHEVYHVKVPMEETLSDLFITTLSKFSCSQFSFFADHISFHPSGRMFCRDKHIHFLLLIYIGKLFMFVVKRTVSRALWC